MSRSDAEPGSDQDGDGHTAAVDVLVRRLADAELALKQAVGTDVDAVMQRAGHAYLMRDAQVALLKSQDELRASEVKYRELFERAPDAIFIIDPDSILTLSACSRSMPERVSSSATLPRS